jgi:hypothetical protein
MLISFPVAGELLFLTAAGHVTLSFGPRVSADSLDGADSKGIGAG